MAREFKHEWVNSETRHLLDTLADKETSVQNYQAAMYQLGMRLGFVLSDNFDLKKEKINIACTVEDADFLAKGLYDGFKQTNNNIFLTVYWNKRFTPNEENQLTVAPILREFHDTGYKEAKTLIVLKSIISSACIVKTNLTKLIEESAPDNIFIVAPVLLKNAQKNLELEFTPDISSKFKYIYFAIDDTKNHEGLVEPGIGGDVYTRLGLGGLATKNQYTPEIVIHRRRQVI